LTNDAAHNMSELAVELLQRLQRVLGSGRRPVPLHEPCFRGNEWVYVKECIDTAWVSSVGKFVDRFEQELAGFAGVRRAVATVNGTAALHICLKLAGVEPNDEVIIPALTFVATANAVCYCGAMPHFADSEEVTLGLDPAKLDQWLAKSARLQEGVCVNQQTGRRISALVPIHTFGHPSRLEALADVARKHQLALVEDAAESLGSYYQGRHVGHWGKVSALSFNGNKTITTGGGGAILTNDPNLADMAKHLTTTAKIPHRWKYEHDQVGYNYRLPNLNAALGCAQMEQLPAFLDSKRRLATKYREALEGLDGARFVQEPPDCVSNYWLCTLLLQPGREQELDQILEATNAAGIMTRPVWALLSSLPMYRDCPRMNLECAASLERRLINVPSSPALCL